jgi:hypothetical protein
MYEDSDGLCKAHRQKSYNHYVISNATIKDFQQVISSEYNITINEKEAGEILTNLVGYFDLLAKIDHREQSENQGSLVSPLKKTD